MFTGIAGFGRAMDGPCRKHRRCNHLSSVSTPWMVARCDREPGKGDLNNALSASDLATLALPPSAVCGLGSRAVLRRRNRTARCHPAGKYRWGHAPFTWPSTSSTAPSSAAHYLPRYAPLDHPRLSSRVRRPHRHGQARDPLPNPREPLDPQARCEVPAPRRRSPGIRGIGASEHWRLRLPGEHAGAYARGSVANSSVTD